MNALPKPLEPQESPRVKPRRLPRRRHDSHRAVAIEITAKLLVNGVLSAAAITALMKLLPYHLSQQAKLREIRMEVGETSERVNKLYNNFMNNNAPEKAKDVMLNHSYKQDPNRRQVRFLAPKSQR
ncbi:MAG: hypothetical protein F6K10_30405 [Moorea sp. SIO2B7]|nr:hypothetical protein [Moorena sp. SIO2B7]